MSFPDGVAELWAGGPAERIRCAEKPFPGADLHSDEEAGRQAGSHLRKYRRSHGVEVADAFVAACAVANNAELWTRNRKHYPMKEIVFFR